MSYSAQDAAISSKVGRAARGGDAFTRARDEACAWLYGQAATERLRISEVAWPASVYAWRELTHSYQKRLPVPEVIFSHMRQAHPQANNLRLLWIFLGQMVAELEPTNVTYARQQIDPQGQLPVLRLQRTRHADDEPESDTSEYVILTTNNKAIGKTALRQVITPDRRQSWLDALVFRPEDDGPDQHMAAYLLAIERAHQAGDVFRTPSHAAMSLRSGRVWQRLIQAGVARVIEPLTPAGGTGLKGYAYIAPQPLAPS